MTRYITAKSILQPWLLIAVMALAQLLTLLLHFVGVSPSQRVFIISSHLLGYGIGAFFFAILFIGSISGIRHFPSPLLQIRHRFILKIIWALTFFIGACGFIASGWEAFHHTTILEFLREGTQGTLRQWVQWGQGYTVLYIFLLPCGICAGLLWGRSNFLGRCLFIMGPLAVSFLYSTLLMSRIILIQFTIMTFLVITRTSFWAYKVKISRVGIAVVSLFCFLIITAAVRDNKTGDSLSSRGLIEGVSKVYDYGLTSMSYSAEIAGTRAFNPPQQICPDFLGRFIRCEHFVLGLDQSSNPAEIDRDVIGAPEYTNVGGVGHVISSYGYFAFLYFVVFAFCYQWVWKKFVKGELAGIVLFPFLTYCCAELFRLDFINSIPGTAMLIVLIGFMLILPKKGLIKRYNSA